MTLVAGAVALGTFGAMAMADISGTSHDFAGFGWAGGEICKPCHTPHGNAGIDHLLRKDNMATDLCLTCDIK